MHDRSERVRSVIHVVLGRAAVWVVLGSTNFFESWVNTVVRKVYIKLNVSPYLELRMISILTISGDCWIINLDNIMSERQPILYARSQIQPLQCDSIELRQKPGPRHIHTARACIPPIDKVLLATRASIRVLRSAALMLFKEMPPFDMSAQFFG